MAPESVTALACSLGGGLGLFSARVLGHHYDPKTDIVAVTGGSRGLGWEVALQVVHLQGVVVVLDVSEPPVAVLGTPGLYFYRCDVSKKDQVLQCQRQIFRDVGTVSVLVNNAGITSGKNVLDLTFEEIEYTIAVNLTGCFYTVKAFLPDMLALRRGYVVTVASALGYLSPAQLSAYGATKAGLIALHELLTYELGPPSTSPQGVKTLLICPGQMRTGMFFGVHTPSWIAPQLEPADVAAGIVAALLVGQRGEVRWPLYTNLLPFYRGLPWQVSEVFRCVTGVDTSMQTFAGRENTLGEGQPEGKKGACYHGNGPARGPEETRQAPADRASSSRQRSDSPCSHRTKSSMYNPLADHIGTE